MKYISIDIETTGLDPEVHQILQIAMVMEDTAKDTPINRLPYINMWVKHNILHFDSDAAGLHSETGLLFAYSEAMKPRYKQEHIEADSPDVVSDQTAVDKIWRWLKKNGYEADGLYKFNVAGKNFNSFDRQFLEKLGYWHNFLHARHRSIDPAILFVYWSTDEKLPSLTECMTRGNVNGLVRHNALDDAKDVIRVLRAKY